jgi:hypothetical protein
MFKNKMGDVIASMAFHNVLLLWHGRTYPFKSGPAGVSNGARVRWRRPYRRGDE